MVEITQDFQKSFYVNSQVKFEMNMKNCILSFTDDAKKDHVRIKEK